MFFENHKSLYEYINTQIDLMKIGKLRFYGNLLPNLLRKEYVCKKIFVSEEELIIYFENDAFVKIKNAYKIVLCQTSFSVVNADEVYFEKLLENSNKNYILYKILNNDLVKISGDIIGSHNIVIDKTIACSSGIAFEILWKKI